MQSFVQSHLKENNRRSIFECVRRTDGISRAEISRQTGISGPTVLKAVDFLIKNGFVIDQGLGNSSVGRKPQILYINKTGHYAVGVDFLANNATIGIMDSNNDVVFCKEYTITPSPNDDQFFMDLCRYVNQTIDKAKINRKKVLGIGISIPGSVDPETYVVVKADVWGINGSACLKKQFDNMADTLGLPVYIENDVNAAALGEYSARENIRSQDIVYVSIGTGIGAGVIIDGKLRRGRQNHAGEIGNSIFDIGGKKDLMEGHFNFPRILHQMRINTRKYGNDYRKFDSDLGQQIEGVADIMAMCVSNIIVCLDIDMLVFGGEYVDLLQESFLDAFRKRLKEYCIIDVVFERNVCKYPGLAGLGWIVMQYSLDTILQSD